MPLQQALRHQHSAFANFFAGRARCPRYKVADPAQAPPTGATAGVDLGIKDFVVTSDGDKIPGARRLARRERSLARYQWRMGRKRRGSNNRAKAKAKVARAHRKVAASRTDFPHRTSTRLVRDHHVVVIADLNVKGMVRNRRRAKAISDAGWAAAGLAVAACGGDIRHPGPSRVQSPAKQEPQPARAGIPALGGEE